MDVKLYLSLSLVMFLEYAVWGAWMPVLAVRLLGPLKMSGKQTGWIYATLPLACIVAPLVAGHVADEWVNTERILAGAHLVGAVLLFLAAYKKTFKSLFIVMLLYSFCYAATLPLVNSFMFYHLAKNNLDAVKYSPYIFMWAPIAWSLIGYFLTGLRWVFKTGADGKDCLYLGAILSVVMGVTCLFMTATPPTQVGTAPILQAMGMLKQTNFLLFVVLSMIAAGMMQFYFLGTARFMEDMGILSKNVPASMAIAQAVQALATLFLLSRLLSDQGIGYKWTLVVGTVCWLMLYVIYVLTKPRWLIVIGQSLHGLAYVFFIIAGQMYVNLVAPPEIVGTMQALIFAATTGVGLFLGTHFAGIVMDKFRREGVFQWRPIFMVPGLVMLICMLGFILLFKANS